MNPPHPVLRFIFSVFFILHLAATLRAEDTIRVPQETVLMRGQTAGINVSGSLSQNGQTQLTIRYPRSVISVKGARGADEFAFTCPNVTIVSDIQTDDTTGVVVLECNSVTPGQSVTILQLDVQALYGSDTEGLLIPQRLIVNGSEVSNVVFSQGTIRLTGGSRPSETSIEAITGNFPNPVNQHTEFIYIVNKDSNPQFAILNLRGQVVKDLGAVAGIKGENRLNVEFMQNELGQGLYVMRMITDLGAYFYTFMKLY